MATVLEPAELESWFLVQWPRGEHPHVVMEFESRAEAEQALAITLGDVAIRIDSGLRWLQVTVRSALSMLEHLELREALAEWDLLIDARALDRRAFDPRVLQG